MAKQRREQTRYRAVVPVANEQGFIMVMALMMLVVLSLMATAAMTVRNTELAIVRNSEVMLNNFYLDEAVMLAAASMLENVPELAYDIPSSKKDEHALSKVTVGYDCNAIDPNFYAEGNPKPDDLCWLFPNEEDLTDSSKWHQNLPNFKPVNLNETKLNTFIPNGYASDGTVNGDRIWYAGAQGNLNKDPYRYDICRGSNLSDPTKSEKCYSLYGMYDVKPGVGKAYTGRRMMMVGYRKTIYNP